MSFVSSTEHDEKVTIPNPTAARFYLWWRSTFVLSDLERVYIPGVAQPGNLFRGCTPA